MWSIILATAILLAQAQPDPAEKWCFERGQRGAQLCESTANACNDLRKINTEIATGPCLRVEPKVEQSGSTAPPASSEKRTPTKPQVQNITTIREACIKANPEIIYKVGACGRIIPSTQHGYCVCGEFLGLLSVKEREIRLADVLYAHQWLRGGIHIGVNQAGRFMICGESTPMKGKYIFTMIGYEIPSLTPAMPEQVSWNLRADTLDEQSDECLTFLAGLLGNNQSDVPEI